jgi:nucleotide-binding universal stress UspA family protein
LTPITRITPNLARRSMAVANHGSPVPARPSPARRAFCVAADERSGAAHRAGWRVLDRFFAGIDVSITAVNVARVPANAVRSLPDGGVFAWPSPRTREQVLEAHDDAKERERQNGERVVRAQAPDEANVDVPFGETVGAVSRAAEDENVDLIVVGSEDKGFLRPLFGGWSQKISRASPRDRY